MNETVFVLFIVGLVMVSWILHGTPKEGMETCSRPLRGPKDIEYPEVYGPSGRSGQTSGSTEQTSGSTGQTSGSTGQTRTTVDQTGVDDSKCSISGQVQKTPGGPIQTAPGLYSAWSDEDVMDSTTMTQNPLYASTFQFQVPSYEMDLTFPTEGPPQPYLTDFSRFHR
jgi:hypothetical protein